MNVISGGRIICGFVRGIGPEYHNFSMNPANSLERFREAHDLIVESWTKPGPFRWEGKHYRFEYVNPWPRPLQQPHPPIWIPSQGSGETIGWAAERRYTFIVTFTPFRNVARFMGQYREAARDFGYDAEPEQMGWALPVYVGATDQGRQSPRRDPTPSTSSISSCAVRCRSSSRPATSAKAPPRAVLRAFSAIGTQRTTIEQLNDNSQIIVGSAETVTRRLRECVDESGIGTLVLLPQFGSMPHEQTVGNMERIAEQVMPALRDHVSVVYR